MYQGGIPPPNEDGTPNETLSTQVVRLRQLMSGKIHLAKIFILHGNFVQNLATCNDCFLREQILFYLLFFNV